jgi:hypothetical protein
MDPGPSIRCGPITPEKDQSMELRIAENRSVPQVMLLEKNALPLGQVKCDFCLLVATAISFLSLT